jgi:hypothetical protein
MWLDRVVLVVRGTDDELEAQPAPCADDPPGEMLIRFDERLVEEDGASGSGVAQLVAQRGADDEIRRSRDPGRRLRAHGSDDHRVDEGRWGGVR